MIYVENKKRKLEKIKEQYPGADILDITSTTDKKWAKCLSPFYPHGNIPIPFSEGYYSKCVEGIWQGLKVFENYGVDMSCFENGTMSGLKRTARKYGHPKGHQKGIHSSELLNYFDARMQIYLPSYKFVLDNIPAAHNVVMKIAERAKEHDIVFLDYNTNTDFRDISSPMSHAGLVKMYIEDTYPKADEKYEPLTEEEIAKRKEAKKAARKTATKKNKRSYCCPVNLFDK